MESDAKFNTFAVIILLKRDHRISKLLDDLKYFFDKIVVVMNADPRYDPVISLVRESMRKIHTIEVVHSESEDFSKLRDLGDEAAKDYTWHFHIDCDETIDVEFLIKKETIVRMHQTLSFRFPRMNLPDKKDYPDHQVRLFKYSKEKIEWRNALHEVLWHIPTNKRLDEYDCVTLNNYHITHSSRKKTLKREWWN